MCLILVAWQVHPDYPLVVAANRDEFFARPTAPAAFWAESPHILAGRDLEAGGTWLGLAFAGQKPQLPGLPKAFPSGGALRFPAFAALTNYRDPGSERIGAPSRGSLVADFLQSAAKSLPGTEKTMLAQYFSSVSARVSAYNGFNLLAAANGRLGYITNRGKAFSVCWLASGIYGLSNHLLNTPWPKLDSARSAFAASLQRLPDDSAFFALLSNDKPAPDDQLPSTGIPLAWERMLSSIFIKSPEYGTRASTLLAVRRTGEALFIERSFGPGGTPLAERRFDTGAM
ncbi:MAG: NRDE family protein [Betaproteobacteria bacterium]|nr:NRDE family protein [Betaproteobacteria bacterium]